MRRGKQHHLIIVVIGDPNLLQQGRTLVGWGKEWTRCGGHGGGDAAGSLSHSSSARGDQRVYVTG